MLLTGEVTVSRVSVHARRVLCSIHCKNRIPVPQRCQPTEKDRENVNFRVPSSGSTRALLHPQWYWVRVEENANDAATNKFANIESKVNRTCNRAQLPILIRHCGPAQPFAVLPKRRPANGTKTPKAKYQVPRKLNRVVYVQNVRGVAFDSFPECFRFLTQALAWHV